MTKSELIETLITKNPKLPIKAVEDSVKEMLEQIMRTLEEGERIEVRGFGSFLYISANQEQDVTRKLAKV